jgi:hypothetical protein
MKVQLKLATVEHPAAKVSTRNQRGVDIVEYTGQLRQNGLAFKYPYCANKLCWA